MGIRILGFFPPARVGQLAQDIAARPRPWLGECTSNLGGLPGVSLIKIKGISAPWDIPSYGLRNLVLRVWGRLPLSILFLGKRGSRWPSPRLWVGLAPNGEEAALSLRPSCCVRPVIFCGPWSAWHPLGVGPPVALGSAQVVFAAASQSPSPVRGVAATGSWIPSPWNCANHPGSQLRPVPWGPAWVPLGKPRPLLWNNTATSP